MIRLVLLLLLALVVLRILKQLRPLGVDGARGGHGDGGAGPWDPHAVLGIVRGATREEITQGYREQMKQYHPDRVADLGPELQQLAHRKSVEIQRAYAELSRH